MRPVNVTEFQFAGISWRIAVTDSPDSETFLYNRDMDIYSETWNLYIYVYIYVQEEHIIRWCTF